MPIDEQFIENVGKVLVDETNKYDSDGDVAKRSAFVVVGFHEDDGKLWTNVHLICDGMDRDALTAISEKASEDDLDSIEFVKTLDSASVVALAARALRTTVIRDRLQSEASREAANMKFVSEIAKSKVGDDE